MELCLLKPYQIALILPLPPFLCTDPCEHLVYDISNCTEWKDVAYLSTDKVSYKKAESTITASFYGNDTNVHYMLCYHYPLEELWPRLIRSLTGNTSVSVNFSWPHSGNADLLVRIHNSSNYTEESYLGCATTSLSVASKFMFIRVHVYYVYMCIVLLIKVLLWINKYNYHTRFFVLLTLRGALVKEYLLIH